MERVLVNMHFDNDHFTIPPYFKHFPFCTLKRYSEMDSLSLTDNTKGDYYAYVTILKASEISLESIN